MKCVCGLAGVVGAGLASVAFMILLVSPSLTNAQSDTRPRPVRPSPGGLRPPPRTEKPPSVREREFKVREMEREAAKPRAPAEEKLALAQIAEDFERIQIINNKMMSAAMSATKPDYASIADTTAEIKKRASRIRDNLRLPKSASEQTTKEPEHKEVVDAARMKAALISLDGLIMSFIKNPIFQEPGVVDIQHAARAGQDLKTIIGFSQLISKDAERLRKDDSKPR